MNKLNKVTASFLAFGFLSGVGLTPVNAEIGSNIALIMDASGSMRAKLSDGTTRIDSAKAAIDIFANTLPSDAIISFRAYGHQSDVSEKNCSDTQLLVPFGKMKDVSDFIIDAAYGLEAKGYTPISHVLGLAADELKPLEGSKTIVLVSDGKETCEGDPCLVAQKLAEADVGLFIHTVGLGVDAATKAQLQCIARVARGKYYDASNAQELADGGSMLKATVVEPQKKKKKKKKKVIKIKANIGTLELVGKSWNNIVVLDAKTDEEIGKLHQVGPIIKVKPGIYNLKYKEKLIQKSVQVIAGETTKLTPAQVKLQIPDTTFLYILDQETGELLGKINAYSDNPDTIPAGRYNFALGYHKKMILNTEIYAAQLNEIPVGKFQIEGNHYEVVIKDAETNEKINSMAWNATKTVLFPGKYNYGVGVDYKLNIPFEIKAGETTLFNPGGVKVIPNGDYKIYSPEGEHIADHNDIVKQARLPKGSYVIKIGNVDVPFEIEDDEIVEIDVE